MTELERADLRIQEICDKIRNETLEPAKEEANDVLEKARQEANRIIAEAKQKAHEVRSALQKTLEEDRRVFDSSLVQACKQTIEHLKLKIEEHFFNPQLANWIATELGGESEHAKLLDVLINALEKEGTGSQLSALIPKKFSADAINAKLSESILNCLKEKSVELADLPAGVLVKVINKHMVLDLSSSALVDIVASFIRKDFRQVFFTK